ncbi:hypothetical protein E2C01_021808 [Portunus trituberculatus]|uniref:Uncharacterized protein n=1 Tax=Portunus trituberculatus TaxID=210409 RepID=A0A5B7E3R0_PORTR|nr:hypothetical protein [Portunus trituberculatus]
MGCSESKDLQQISVSNAQKKLESSLEGLEVVRMTSSATSSGQGSSVPHTPEEKDQQRARESPSGIPTSLENIPTNDLGVSIHDILTWLERRKEYFRDNVGCV